MSRLNKTHEIIELATLMQNSFGGLTIEDIQNHFECSRRSAERMKSLLFDIFPDKIEEVQTNEKKKRWRFVKGTMNALISFTADDFANLEYLKGLSNDENRQKQIEELISKIKALTPQKNLQSLDTDISAILEFEGFAVRQYSRVKVEPKILEQLHNALLAFKKVKFEYIIDGEIQPITLDPYGIIISEKYYLVGFNKYVNDRRLYLVNEIKKLEILDEYFDRDENFSLSEYCAQSFKVYQEDPLGVVLEFDKLLAEDVQNYHFHPTQEIEVLKDGNVEVRFTAGATISICNELFKWGEYVTIKSPEKLKEVYKEQLKKVLERL
jgi:predicted DNA-binding transcriptional regulator YafY